MTDVSVNMVVDIQQSLTPQKGMALARDIAELNGVTQARLSERSARLLLVDFDAKVTEARHILAAFRNQGYDARLIGM